MATFSRRQTKTVQDTTGDITVTLDSAPLEGNLLIAIQFCRGVMGNDPTPSTPTGWTKVFHRNTAISVSNRRRGLAMFYKIAGANEPASQGSFNYNAEDVNRSSVIVQELEASETVTWTLEASVSNDNGTTENATSLSTGTTGSVSAGNLLLVAGLGMRISSSSVTSANFDNDIGNETNNVEDRFICIGFGKHTTGGTKSATATWSGNNTGASAGLLVFRATAATASDTRNARIKGLSTTSNTRNARTKGAAIASNTRNARTKGAAIASNTRNARTKGSLTTSDTRGARTKGIATTSNTRSAHTKGSATTSDTRGAKTKGVIINTTSDNRGARTKGLDTLSNNRSARTKGFDIAGSTRNARVRGYLTTSDNRGARTKGKSTASNFRDAHTKGSATTSDTRGAKTKGRVVSYRNAKVKGPESNYPKFIFVDGELAIHLFGKFYMIV